MVTKSHRHVIAHAGVIVDDQDFFQAVSPEGGVTQVSSRKGSAISMTP